MLNEERREVIKPLQGQPLAPDALPCAGCEPRMCVLTRAFLMKTQIFCEERVQVDAALQGRSLAPDALHELRKPPPQHL